MRIYIKTNSKRVLNYIQDQCEKARNNYFESKKDFWEHLFQSIWLITPWAEIIYDIDKKTYSDEAHIYESWNINIEKTHNKLFEIDDTNFKI